jgi:hypothetical protein
MTCSQLGHAGQLCPTSCFVRSAKELIHYLKSALICSSFLEEVLIRVLVCPALAIAGLIFESVLYKCVLRVRT